MPAEIYLDSVDLECETLEAEYPSAEKAALFRDIYPYPLLLRTGRSAVMTFRAIHLENELIKATVLPDLGGRIVAIRDKRTGTDVLPMPRKLELLDGGPRLAWCPQGIQFILGDNIRHNSLGPVEFLIREPDSEDEDAGLILFEIVSGTRIGWQAVIALSPALANLRIQFTAQNRNLKAAYVESGINLASWSTCRVSPDKELIYVGDAERRAGLVAAIHRGEFAELHHETHLVSLLRMGASAHGVLLGRHSDSWGIDLLPVTGLANPAAISRNAAMEFSDQVLRVSSQETRPGTRSYLQLQDGQSLQADLDLYAERPSEVDISSLPTAPSAFLITGTGAEPMLQWTSDQPILDVAENSSMWLLPTEPPDSTAIPSSEADWQVALAHFEADSPEWFERVRALGRDPGYRHLISLIEAAHASATDGFGEAVEKIDVAIGYSAEDALLWWLKGSLSRLAGWQQEDSPELPNAHFLSPLEPALRAEAFLSQPQLHTKDPNPLVKPFANHPDAMIEVAVLLLEMNLRQEAARWIDECLRHKEEPMLRYLAAWNLLTGSRMEAEAFQHVQAASQAPWEPPFPWRGLELRAIKTLHARFGDDARLNRLAELMTIV